MPILDHFRPPLFPTHSWESFLMRWATAIADSLDRQLPDRFFAEVHTRFGTQTSANVAEFDCSASPTERGSNGQPSEVAIQPWAPPVATMKLPFTFPDDLEVRIRDERDDARVVAVVELVSPRNKDRPEARRGFAAKCAAYLQRGLGVVIVDLVTTRQNCLHNELMDLLDYREEFRLGEKPSLLALAYHPRHSEGQDQVSVWAVPLQIGGTLPVLPLGLRSAGPVPLDLEATYTETRTRCRL